MKGKRLFEKVKERFPENQSTPNDWLQAWRDLAEKARNVEEADWRFLGVMDLLDACDEAFAKGNWADFARLSEKVKTLCQRK